MSATAAPTSTAILEVRDLHAAYGRIEVLRGVSFRVPQGSVVALLGPNGAGKTTTLKVCSGQMPPTAGEVRVGGVPLAASARPEDLVRIGMCTVPEGRGIFPNLSVEENLRLAAYAGHVPEGAIRERAYQRFPRLGERRRQLAGTLSGGEQQMLAMSRALATDPPLLLLDELSMGLAPLIVEELYEIVRQLAEEGVSILVVEQFARTALAVADYGVVMVGGRVVAIGQPDDLSGDIERAYLGGAA